MSDAQRPNSEQHPPSASGERRALTADEMKQIDSMLGLGGGPTLIRPVDPAPAPSTGSGPLLRAAVVGIILAAIVVFAFYLFR